ncbi:hypothetical protein SeLEV6574_g06230 [Synchytrium endobioticum]|nr:hypothetical protein SeLEV6574_g06230 [Synchytrium endobioticum]
MAPELLLEVDDPDYEAAFNEALARLSSSRAPSISAITPSNNNKLLSAPFNLPRHLTQRYSNRPFQFPFPASKESLDSSSSCISASASASASLPTTTNSVGHSPIFIDDSPIFHAPAPPPLYCKVTTPHLPQSKSMQSPHVCILSSPIPSRDHSSSQGTAKTVLTSKGKTAAQDVSPGAPPSSPPNFFHKRTSSATESTRTTVLAAPTPLDEIKLSSILNPPQSPIPIAIPNPTAVQQSPPIPAAAHQGDTGILNTNPATPFVPYRNRRTRRRIDSPASSAERSIHKRLQYFSVLSSPDHSQPVKRPGRRTKGPLIKSPLTCHVSHDNGIPTVDLVSPARELTRLRKVDFTSSPLKQVDNYVVEDHCEQDGHSQNSKPRLERLINKRARGKNPRKLPRQRQVRLLEEATTVEQDPPRIKGGPRLVSDTFAHNSRPYNKRPTNPFIDHEAQESLSDGEGGRIDSRLIASDDENDSDPDLNKELEGFVCDDDDVTFHPSANPEFIAQHHPAATQVIAMYHDSIRNRGRVAANHNSRVGRYYRIQDILEYEDWEVPLVNEDELVAGDDSFVIDDDGAGYIEGGSDDLWSSEVENEQDPDSDFQDSPKRVVQARLE